MAEEQVERRLAAIYIAQPVHVYLLLGGRLEVTSETGKGSVFNLTVPVEFDEKRM